VTKKTKPRETFLPGFGGFYQSHWEQLLSDIEELYAAMHAEQEREQGGLDEDELVEILSETSSISRLCTGIARSFCEGFDTKMSEKLGFRLGLKFSKLESPSEYNFTTDRILARMPLRSAKKLFELSMRERHKRLDEAIRDWFTPYSGFIPHYSDCIGDWIAKPIAEWDANELCVLLDAFVDTDIDEDLYHEIAEGDAYEAFESFRRLEALREEGRRSAERKDRDVSGRIGIRGRGIMSRTRTRRRARCLNGETGGAK
jgi:hypothetical protein